MKSHSLRMKNISETIHMVSATASQCNYFCFFRLSNYISETHSHTIYIFFYINLCLYLYPFVLLTVCISSLPFSTYWSMCLLVSMHVAVLICTFHHIFLYVKVLVRMGRGQALIKLWLLIHQTIKAFGSKNQMAIFKVQWIQKAQ